MRPKSILWFERLYWASLAVELLSIGLFEFPDPEMGMVGSVIVFGFICALMALLWWLIAVRASRIAMWVFVVLTAVDIGLSFAFPEEISTGAPVGMGLSLASSLFGLVSCYFLFRADARRWFANRGVGDVDPNTFF